LHRLTLAVNRPNFHKNRYMKVRHKTNHSKISKLRKAITIVSLVVFSLWGIIASVLSIIKIQNYIRPYFFGFSLVIVGLVLGIFVSIRLKPYVCFNSKMYNEYTRTPVAIVFGFIGSLLFLGVTANQSLSHREKCGYYKVVDKLYVEGRSRQPSIINLFVDIDRKITTIHCNQKYWESVIIGQEVYLCYYKSRLGFDYLLLDYKNQ
jgi:hypothetical protein